MTIAVKLDVLGRDLLVESRVAGRHTPSAPTDRKEA
jgi:hypothetical protein